MITNTIAVETDFNIFYYISASLLNIDSSLTPPPFLPFSFPSLLSLYTCIHMLQHTLHPINYNL